jgi:hypothetical protein
MAALGAGYLVARRRGDRLWCRYITVAALLVVAALLAISRSDRPYAYTFEWRTFIAPLSILVPLVPILDALISGRERATRFVAAGAAIAVTVASIAAIPHLHRDARPDPIAEVYVQRLVAVLDDERVSGRTIAIRSDPLDLYGPMFLDTVVNEIDRRGGRVTVPRSRFFMSIYGDGRAGRPTDADTVWYAVRRPDRFEEIAAVRGARVIWPLTAAFGIVEVPASTPPRSLDMEPRRHGANHR